MILHKNVLEITSGEITDAVNAPLFAQKQHATEFIKGFRTGALKQDLRGLLEFIAPSVRISATADNTYGYKIVKGVDDLPMNNHDTMARGEGGEFGYVGSIDDLAVGKLKNYGLSSAVENKDLEADPAHVQDVFNRLVNLIDGAKVLKAINKLDEIASTNTKQIALTDNPLAVIEEYLNEVSQLAGFMPNRMLVGRGFFIKLKNQLLNSANAWSFSAPRTIEELGQSLGVEILTPKAHYKAGSTLPLIANDTAYAFVGEEGISREDLSNLKTFNSGDMDFFEADHPQGRLKILTVSEYVDIATTSAVGASKFKFANG